MSASSWHIWLSGGSSLSASSWLLSPSGPVTTSHRMWALPPAAPAPSPQPPSPPDLTSRWSSSWQCGGLSKISSRWIVRLIVSKFFLFFPKLIWRWSMIYHDCLLVLWSVLYVYSTAYLFEPIWILIVWWYFLWFSIATLFAAPGGDLLLVPVWLHGGQEGVRGDRRQGSVLQPRGLAFLPGRGRAHHPGPASLLLVQVRVNTSSQDRIFI